MRQRAGSGEVGGKAGSGVWADGGKRLLVMAGYGQKCTLLPAPPTDAYCAQRVEGCAAGVSPVSGLVLRRPTRAYSSRATSRSSLGSALLRLKAEPGVMNTCRGRGQGLRLKAGPGL